MSEENTVKSPQRREFFKKAGLGAGTAAVVGTLGSIAEPASAALDPSGSQGYRETEHVKRVYELSKF